jgi:hypothetical protein
MSSARERENWREKEKVIEAKKKDTDIMMMNDEFRIMCKPRSLVHKYEMVEMKRRNKVMKFDNCCFLSFRFHLT